MVMDFHNLELDTFNGMWGVIQKFQDIEYSTRIDNSTIFSSWESVCQARIKQFAFLQFSD